MEKSITGNKILAHLDRVVGDHKPITADIFLNNFCNDNCPYCTYKRWEFDDAARSMSYEDFVRYGTRLRELGVQGFILSGGGEPTIAKDFQKIVGWLDAEDIKYGINTNFNKFVKCNPQYLKVSLDAWDETSYKQKRGVYAYSQVVQNIVHFSEIKSEHTRLGIQLLAMDMDSVYKFYDANRTLPVDYIVIRPVESTNGKYYSENPHTQSITSAIDEIARTDQRVIKNYKWDLLHQKFGRCIGQWSQIAINELGEVMYCCHKPYQIVGHIMDDDILEKKGNADTDMNMCDVPCRLTGVNHDLQKIYKQPINPEFI